MPKFEITLEGVRTNNYTYTTIIEAKDEDDAWDKAEQIEPEQKEWVFVGFEDETDNLIELDGIGDVEEVEEYSVIESKYDADDLKRIAQAKGHSSSISFQK